MGRGLALCAVVLAVAGCGGGSDEPATAEGVAGAQVEHAPRVREDAWATRAEVDWLGDVSTWNAAFARAGSRVAAFESGPRFDDVLRGDDAAVAAYASVLEPIRRCGATFAERVGRAPSERLGDTERTFRSSCAHYGRGVELMLRAVDEQDERLADRARSEIEDAGKEASVAAGTLPPGEKQPLPSGREGDASRVDPTFSDAASAVAEKDVEARCWAPADWRRLMVEEKAYTAGKVNETVLGFASAGGERLNLAPQICHALARLAYRDERPSARQEAFALALGVATLAHESVHASGVADEPTAECHGIQRLERTAESLGVDRAYARRLRDVYWAHYDELPSMYRSPECRDGGGLDLDRDSTAFP